MYFNPFLTIHVQSQESQILGEIFEEYFRWNSGHKRENTMYMYAFPLLNPQIYSFRIPFLNAGGRKGNHPKLQVSTNIIYIFPASFNLCYTIWCFLIVFSKYSNSNVDIKCLKPESASALSKEPSLTHWLSFPVQSWSP